MEPLLGVEIFGQAKRAGFGWNFGWNFEHFETCFERKQALDQGLVNVPIEHHPTIEDIISNRYLFWCSKSPNFGTSIPTPVDDVDVLLFHHLPPRPLLPCL